MIDRSAAVSQAVQLETLWRAAVQQGLPVAFWRQPRAHAPAGLVSLRPPQEMVLPDLARRRSGFLLAPFSDDSPALFLLADLVWGEGTLHVAQDGLAGADAHAAAAFFETLPALSPGEPLWVPGAHGDDRALSEPEFQALVAEAVEFIRARRIAKVVVSRTAAVDLPPGFDPVALFETLCRRYPDAFVSLVAVPGVGTWIGASPELLMGLEEGRLTTMALAGTQRRPADLPLEAVRWGNKEQVEQEMVTAYIRRVFEESGVAPVIERGPQTVAAGGVVHLQTLFESDPAHPASLQTANAVLERLHPTSAVCGMPRPQALQFIEAREGYDRGFYSGYLGPVHWQGCTELYVNLRCMQLREQSAALYMGAGVTADSDPAAEWAETTLKARTILDALDEARLHSLGGHGESAVAFASPLASARKGAGG